MDTHTGAYITVAALFGGLSGFLMGVTANPVVRVSGDGPNLISGFLTLLVIIVAGYGVGYWMGWNDRRHGEDE